MSENKKKKKDKVVAALNFGNGLVSFGAALLAIVLILYSGYVLYDSMAIEVSAFSSNSDLLKYKPSVMAQASDNGPSLAEINEDYRGWVTVGGEPASPIDYPVVQGKDDLYYASRDVYQGMSLTGAIYLAAGNKGDFSDSYNLLYGHHMDNGAMFGSLDKFRNKNYFSTHQTATIAGKDNAVYDVTFFAVISTDAYEDQVYNVGNRAKEVMDFLTGDRDSDAGIGTQVIIYDQAAAAGASKIIALSTCASADTNGRLVLFGKMVMREPEKPTDQPTDKPTDKPSDQPTDKPTDQPTDKPTETPTRSSSGGGSGKATSTPTPTPEPERQVKLVVKYYEGEEKIFPDEVLYYTPGSGYYVVSPQKPGYEADIQIVQGTIEEDMTVIVRYTPKEKELTLKISYIFADGQQAAPPYSRTMPLGTEYDVPSPEIEGYKTLLLRVSGTAMPGSKMHYVVIYVPENQELIDPPTPLGFERTFMQVGICFE